MGRILVADDHDSLRRGIVRALSDAKHDVDEAPNGNVAIEKLHEGQYDVVVSDLKMGGSDGMDVLRTAKALHPTSRAWRSGMFVAFPARLAGERRSLDGRKSGGRR